MRKKRLSFEEWIDTLGVSYIAKTLKVDPVTVRNWRAWRCDPRVNQIRKIKKLSYNRLSYEQIIDRSGK